MKKTTLFFVVCSLLMGSLFGQTNTAEKKEPVLKTYYFVLLKKGPKRNQDSVTVARVQQEHINYLMSLSKSGKMDIAGPFADETDWRGICIFNLTSEEEVKRLIEKDPWVKLGRLSYEIHPWMSMQGSVLR